MKSIREKQEAEKRAEAEEKEQNDYRQAFQAAQSEIAELRKTISSLKEQQTDFLTKLQAVSETQQADKKALFEKVDAGLSKLDEDNKRLHALIQSAQDSDLKLVEQMDKNHRERMSEILKLVGQKASPDV